MGIKKLSEEIFVLISVLISDLVLKNTFRSYVSCTCYI